MDEESRDSKDCSSNDGEEWKGDDDGGVVEKSLSIH